MKEDSAASTAYTRGSRKGFSNNIEWPMNVLEPELGMQFVVEMKGKRQYRVIGQLI